jgi:hypothetical protein
MSAATHKDFVTVSLPEIDKTLLVDYFARK